MKGVKERRRKEISGRKKREKGGVVMIRKENSRGQG